MSRWTKWSVLLALCALSSCSTEPFEMGEPLEGEVVESDWEPMRTVQGEELDDEEVDALLARLPALQIDEDDEVEFKRREESLPPPIAGDDIDGDWPPDLSGDVAQPTPDGSLKAQAFRPEGEVEPPFQVAIAFDRPVVEVGAVGQQETPPVEMAPQVEGRWRWLGTQTVVFEPEEDWPMATEFDIELAEGLEAIDGTRLEETLRFAFATPAPEVTAVYPTGDRSQARDAAVAVVFNQSVEQESAEAIEVGQQRGAREVPMNVAEEEERREVAEGYGIGEVDDQGRVIALTPREKYDYDQTVEIRVDGPIKSSEGPVVGMVDESASFDTYGAFGVDDVTCAWRDDCRPGSPIHVHFSNAIDDDDAESKVEVTPAVDDLSVSTQGQLMTIHGDFRALTDYDVRIDAALTDEFGQTMEEDGSGQLSYETYLPLVVGPDEPMVIRPAGSAPVVSATVAGVEQFRMRVYDVTPEDWTAFDDYTMHDRDDPGGELVQENTHSFAESERHELQGVPLDFSEAITGGTGHAVVTIDSVEPWEGSRGFRSAYWVQKTDLSLDLSSDYREMTASVSTLSDGTDVAGAEIVADGQVLGQTDASGVASFDVPTGDLSEVPFQVVDGDDELFLPVEGRLHHPGGSPSWSTRDTTTNPLWYVVDDRQTYKPGETAVVRGWVRELENTPRSQPTQTSGDSVQYEVLEPRRNEIASGEVEVDDFGGFELEFEVPDEANLGTTGIVLSTTVDGSAQRHVHTVEFQEFRRPEYEVTLETDEGPHRVAETTEWNAEASYYAGGAVSEADTEWDFSESSATYSPPGWSDYQFGEWQMWWSPWARDDDSSARQVLPEHVRGEERTDAQGNASAQMHFESPDRGFPRRVEGTVSVEDVDRQSWEASDSVLVHPSQLYVGVRSADNFIQRDESWDGEAIVVDVDGEVIEDREVEFVLNRRRHGDLEAIETCTEVSQDDAVGCSFSGMSPGRYRVVATVEDDEGRTSETEIDFVVSGQDRSGAETAEEDELLLIPEDDEYAPGDTATLAVQAPYYPLDAVLELRRDGAYHRERVEITEADPTVEFEIEEEMIPNVHVRVAAIGKDGAHEPDHFASGTLEVDVDPGPRTLDVDISPQDEVIEPGSELSVDASVTDAEGNAVEGAQVLLYAVDESVLAISDYQLADPIRAFYPTRSARMSDIRTRSWLLLDFEEYVEEALEEASVSKGRHAVGRVGGAAMGQADAGPEFYRLEGEASPQEQAGSDDPDPIDVREVFDALAFHRSDLVTDADGRVQVTEEMPDSLTRYRLMAVAIDGDTRFGTGEEDITARRPLMVSPSPPRFLNVGDHFDFPVVLHNRGDEALEVEVALNASPKIQWLERPGRRVEIPADDRREIRFAGRVDRAGTARIQVATAAGDDADAELVEFPVLTPATTEAFATYGTIDADSDDAVVEGLKVPQDVYTQFGGLEVSASSTQLQALTDAFIHLVDYPFAFTEPLASRILSVIALYDVLDAFDASELPEPAEVRASMQDWIDDLEQLQRNDGGFGTFSDARRSHPMASVHAMNALIQARQEGYNISSDVFRQGWNYLLAMGQHVSDYPDRAAASAEAYALYVRHRMDEDVGGRALDQLLGNYGVDDIPLEAVGWLLPIAQGTQHEERLMQRVTGQVQETSATAEFQETYDSGANRILHTTRRTDGVVLDGLMSVEPDHPLVEKVVRGLLAHRERGRWSNTQENVFILRALRRYFDTYEDVEPDFVARAWLGDEHIAEHAFEGRTTERYGVDVPMSYIHRDVERLPVIFQRDGSGRMYYRMGVRYAPTSRKLDPLNEGFSVERTYEAVDDPDDVRRTDDGWEIKAGARVRVELSMTVPARRHHVALVDWLPAGFEPLNPALAVTSVDDDLTGGSSDARRWGWWARPWYQHQNLRDERVEAFSSQVSEGVHTYSYVARATTPGEFIAMPAKAEEMYHPETFGRSASEIVTVVGK